MDFKEFMDFKKYMGSKAGAALHGHSIAGRAGCGQLYGRRRRFGGFKALSFQGQMAGQGAGGMQSYQHLGTVYFMSWE